VGLIQEGLSTFFVEHLIEQTGSLVEQKMVINFIATQIRGDLYVRNKELHS
jgi:hypothetical protein